MAKGDEKEETDHQQWRERMLFNKSTGKPDTDILSLDSLIAWLEQHPADRGYNYCSASNCLLSQYFTAMGLKGVSVTPFVYRTGEYSWSEKTHALPEGWEEIANGFPSGLSNTWTFGKALERARKLQKERVK